MTKFEYIIIIIAVIASLVALLGYNWGYNEGKMEILTNLMFVAIEKEEESNE